MIQTQLEYNKENIWEFVKHTFLRKRKANKWMFFLLIGILLCICLISIIGSVLTDQFLLLLFPVVILIMGGMYFLFFVLMLKGMAKKLLESSEMQEPVTVMLKNDTILLMKNEIPMGLLDWKKLQEISIGTKAGYLITEKGALLIFEYTKLTHGTPEELRTLLTEKQHELASANGTNAGKPKE